ncbi:MAG TPA: polysaccharide deacetylase family protein [Chthoniobacterales bacterium]
MNGARRALRKHPPLLDRRIPKPPMSAARLLPFFLCLATFSLVAAPDQAPRATAAEKSAKPAASPEPRLTFSAVHVDEPYIAMTFDDGPHATLTPKLLDLLAARHIKVTFFVLGECVEQNPEVLRRAAREGHEIGNHSWSHPQFTRLSDEAIRSQLRRTDDAIKAITGKRPTLFRPPYGAISARQKKWIHDEFGYDIILWDVDPLDWKDPGPTTVANRILRETRAGSIVLSHDIHRGTVEAMPATLEQLKAKQFKFVTVTELLGLATPEPPKPMLVRKNTADTGGGAPVPGNSPISNPDSAVKNASPAESLGQLQPAPPPATPAASPGL